MNIENQGKLHLYCPHCGSKLLDANEVKDADLTCKRCKTKIVASVNRTKIEMEFIKHPINNLI